MRSRHRRNISRNQPLADRVPQLENREIIVANRELNPRIREISDQCLIETPGSCDYSSYISVSFGFFNDAGLPVESVPGGGRSPRGYYCRRSSTPIDESGRTSATASAKTGSGSSGDEFFRTGGGRRCNRTAAVKPLSFSIERLELWGPNSLVAAAVPSDRSCPILLKKSISRTLAKFSVLMEIYYEITFRFLRHA